MPAVDGGVVNNEQLHASATPPARVRKRIDFEVHALRGFKLPNRRCLLALAFVEHLRNPFLTSRLNLRAMKIRCKVQEDRGEENKKVAHVAIT